MNLKNTYGLLVGGLSFPGHAVNTSMYARQPLHAADGPGKDNPPPFATEWLRSGVNRYQVLLQSTV